MRIKGTTVFVNFNNNTLYQPRDTEKNPWVVLYTRILQLMTHTTNAYITAAFFETILLSLLTYCRR